MSETSGRLSRRSEGAARVRIERTIEELERGSAEDRRIAREIRERLDG